MSDVSNEIARRRCHHPHYNSAGFCSSCGHRLGTVASDFNQPCPAGDCDRTQPCRPPAPECPHPWHGEIAGRKTDPKMVALVGEAAAALADVYEPQGVLMYWSARITYLDDKRPCDIYRDGDLVLMERLVQHVNALADGAFL